MKDFTIEKQKNKIGFCRGVNTKSKLKIKIKIQKSQQVQSK